MTEQVELRLPAASAYLAVLRTTTAGLAARRDFTIEEIEDLRIAVDEASAMLLEQARPGTTLDAVFELGDADLKVQVSATSDDPQAPDKDSFAWTVFAALAGDVDAGTDGDRVSISLHKRRGTV